MSAADTTQVAGQADLADEILRYAGLAEGLLGPAGGDEPAADLDDVRRFYAGHPDLPLLRRDGPVRSLHVPLSLGALGTDAPGAGAGAGQEGSGFLAQPGLVARVIEEWPTPVRSVIELGCAEGFNTAWLARRFPGIAFTGYDLIPAHIEAATGRLADVTNARFGVADFHRLPVPAGHADLVFSVESIIHSPDMAAVLGQAHAALRPGGGFFAIELFRPSAARPGVPLPGTAVPGTAVPGTALPGTAVPGTVEPETAARLARAAALTEALLAIPAMYAVPDWIALADELGLSHAGTADLTAAALPGLLRMSRLFGRVLERQGARSDDELRSILTALLICRTMQIGLHGLYAIRLIKR